MPGVFADDDGSLAVKAPGGTIRLDPARPSANSVITHAHEDHIPTQPKRRKGTMAAPAAAPEAPDNRTLMTAPTLDLVRLRRPRQDGVTVAYARPVELAGAWITLAPAGHVLGSAMARIETPEESVLYTGDFSPIGGPTAGRAVAERCDTLVLESTYGDPRFVLPPKDLVLANLETWVLRRLLSGSVALGAHPLGRAQELIGLLNRLGIVPIVSGEIAQIAAIYNAHGQDLAWAVLGSAQAEADRGSSCYVVPQSYLRRDHPFAARLSGEGGGGAFLSGWCQVFSYFDRYFIEAQFPLTDHATFPELLSFAKACAPKNVITVHGKAATLAAEVERRLGIPARPLLDRERSPAEALVASPP